MSKINFDDLSVEKSFRDYYIVPDYQREYIWEERQVSQLLNDTYDEFNYSKDREYFIGSIVVVKNNEHHEIIDGQQRLTTLFLILCAFKELYNENGQDTRTIEISIKDTTVDSRGDSVSKYKLELQYQDASNILAQIAENGSAGRPAKTYGSIERLYDAYEIIISFLREKFLGNIDLLKLFFVFIYRNLKYIQITTPEMNEALKIFETINERGVGLNPMDLLKNLIFRQVSPDKFKQLNANWKSIVELLDTNNEKPLRFLRYFIMANYDINNPKNNDTINEDEIYTWITQDANIKQCNYKVDPFGFVEKLKSGIGAYINYIKGMNTDGSTNIYLDNLKKLGGGAFRQHLILFLAAQNMDISLFVILSINIEVLLFYYFITRVSGKDFERNFTKWAKEIRKISNESDLNNFIKSTIKPEIDRRKSDFDKSFSSLTQYSMQQYRMRYILSKISLYVEQERLSNSTPKPLDTYFTKGIEIEHILPDTPEKELYDQYKENYDNIKIKIGNLTLLEKSINCSIGNKDFFTTKLPEYKKSSIYLTKSISEIENVGVNTAINRINNKLQSFSSWSEKEIDERTQMLLKLANDVWRIDI